MSANPVVLPPPNLVFRPKIEILSTSDLYVLARRALMSAFETLAISGWMSEMFYE